MFDLLEYAVRKGEELGGEFVEARFDNFITREIHAEKEIVRGIRSSRRVGI